MSQDHIQSQIDFIIEQQARFSADIDELKDIQKRQAENHDRLTADVQTLAHIVDVNREEMREAINNLIIANEVTRNLAENVARLATAVSQRVTAIESSRDSE